MVRWGESGAGVTLVALGVGVELPAMARPGFCRAACRGVSAEGDALQQAQLRMACHVPSPCDFSV